MKVSERKQGSRSPGSILISNRKRAVSAGHNGSKSFRFRSFRSYKGLCVCYLLYRYIRCIPTIVSMYPIRPISHLNSCFFEDFLVGEKLEKYEVNIVSLGLIGYCPAGLCTHQQNTCAAVFPKYQGVVIARLFLYKNRGGSDGSGAPALRADTDQANRFHPQSSPRARIIRCPRFPFRELRQTV